MKLEPYKYYIEDNKYTAFIYYMYTDDTNVYDVMRINKQTKVCIKDKGKTILTAIEHHSDIYTNIVEISEGEFLLQTL